MGLDLASRITYRTATKVTSKKSRSKLKPRQQRRRRRGFGGSRLSTLTKTVGSIRLKVPTHTSIPYLDRQFNLSLHGSGAIEDTRGLRRLETDPLTSLVVAIDGACFSNGYPNARASYGVFFSSSDHSSASRLNQNGRLPVSVPQTSQYAELYAAMKALETVMEMIIGGEEVSHLVLKTDSEYLERGVCRYVWKWVGNGWRNWRGQPVVNGPGWRYLHEKVGLLERQYGVKVSFCRVPRELNQQADALAKVALMD